MLKREASLAFARGNLRHVLAIKQNLRVAGIGKFQPGDGAEQRGLAGPGRPEQRDKFAGFDLEAHAVERGEVAELFRDVDDFDAHLMIPVSFCFACWCSTQVLIPSVTSARNASNDATANAPAKL